MRFNRKFCFFLFVSTIFLIFYVTVRVRNKQEVLNIIRDRGKTKNENLKPSNKSEVQKRDVIKIAVVTCGQRLQESLNMMKSAILFNQGLSYLNFIIVSEDIHKEAFHEKLSDWQVVLPDVFNFKILSLQFPVKNSKEWKSLFKPCAAQRLFLPSLLSDEDAVLYVDTDTVFLSPVSDVWHHFIKFNSTQIAGLSSEHEDKNVGWYNRFARHPFYGPMGVNSGVMLMNLTRMRQFKWEDHILPIHDEYKMSITWGDQDLINILFHFHPDKLYIFHCAFNYRPDHCMYMSVCNVTNGVQIMHGNRGYFHSDKQPVFNTVYNAIESYQLGKDPYINFLQPLAAALEDDSVVNSNCGKVIDNVLEKAKKLFLEKSYYYN